MGWVVYGYVSTVFVEKMKRLSGEVVIITIPEQTTTPPADVVADFWGFKKNPPCTDAGLSLRGQPDSTLWEFALSIPR